MNDLSPNYEDPQFPANARVQVKTGDPKITQNGKYGNVIACLEGEVQVQLDGSTEPNTFSRWDIENVSHRTTYETPELRREAPHAKHEIGQPVYNMFGEKYVITRRHRTHDGWGYKLSSGRTTYPEDRIFASYREWETFHQAEQDAAVNAAILELEETIGGWQCLAFTASRMSRRVTGAIPVIDSYEKWHETADSPVTDQEIQETRQQIADLADKFEAFAGRYRRHLKQITIDQDRNISVDQEWRKR